MWHTPAITVLRKQGTRIASLRPAWATIAKQLKKKSPTLSPVHLATMSLTHLFIIVLLELWLDWHVQCCIITFT
jgi:hypothetical protein